MYKELSGKELFA